VRESFYIILPLSSLRPCERNFWFSPWRLRQIIAPCIICISAIHGGHVLARDIFYYLQFLSPSRRLQIPEEIRVRLDHERGIAADGAIALQRLEEGVELRVRAVGAAVDARRLGVGLADDLLRLARGFGADGGELALHVAQDFLALALAFRAEALGDALPFGDHAVLDLHAHRVDVIDALQAHVDQLDAEPGHQARGGGQHFLFQPGTALLWFLEVGIAARQGGFIRLQLADVDIPVGGADDLLQFGAGDNVARHRVDDVVQARARPDLIAHGTQELQGIDNAPARGCVDGDELASQRRDLADVAVPDQQAFVEPAYLLDEGQLPVQSGFGDDVALRLAELHDDALLSLIDHEQGVGGDDDQQHRDNQR
jgi:hypothetical protein